MKVNFRNSWAPTEVQTHDLQHSRPVSYHKTVSAALRSITPMHVIPGMFEVLSVIGLVLITHLKVNVCFRSRTSSKFMQCYAIGFELSVHCLFMNSAYVCKIYRHKIIFGSAHHPGRSVVGDGAICPHNLLTPARQTMFCFPHHFLTLI